MKTRRVSKNMFNFATELWRSPLAVHRLINLYTVMKKILLALAFVGVSMASMAQDADPVLKYSVATNSFWSNWFVQVGVDWNAFYVDEEHGQSSANRVSTSHSPFKSERAGVGASLAVGKWFTPGLGLRTKLQGWKGKEIIGKANYWTLNEQVMFNLSNLFCGYNPTRVWNVIPFAGAGVSRNCDLQSYNMELSLGLQSSWRLSKHVNLYLEAGWNMNEHDFSADLAKRGKKGWDTHDNNVYAELGLNFNLGSATWNKVPDVDAIKQLSQAQIDALQAQLNDANAENARLKALLAQKPKEAPTAAPEVVKEYGGAPVSVFFNLNKSNVSSKKDLVNVKELAKYAKDNNAGLLVKGYADSKTGTASYNQKLSEKRAESVANELVKMGVSRDNIEVKGMGGVKDLSPISYNRRATVELK